MRNDKKFLISFIESDHSRFYTGFIPILLQYNKMDYNKRFNQSRN